MTTYREDNWKLDPEVDLDYENKFFQITFNATVDIEKIDLVWRSPIKDFLEKEDKGKVLRGFPDPLIIGFFLEDISKEYLTRLVDELKALNLPETVSIIRWKNHKDSKTFNSFLDFQSYIKNITE